MIIKKLRNISPYSIEEFESWLSDMAKEGLLLCGFQWISCSFEKAEPQEMEYRIEMSRRGLSSKYINLYEENGWKYVCSYSGFHVFCAPKTDNLLEIHTDPVEQSNALKQRISDLKKFILFAVILLMFYIVNFMFFLKIGNTPYLNLIDSGLQFIFGIIVMTWCIAIFIRQLIKTVRIKTTLKMGMGMNHHAKWKKSKKGIICVGIIYAVIIILYLMSLLYSVRYIVGAINGSNDETLTFDTNLQFVRLNDIEVYNNPVMMENDFNPDINYSNHVRKKDMLMYKEYKVTETFKLENETWEGNVYQPSLNTEYYEIKVPFLINDVFNDVLYRAEHYYSYVENSTTEEITYEGLDKVYYIHNNSGRYAIVVLNDNKVVSMKYCGKQPYMKVIEAAVNKIK